jgi:hypothetical protein
MTTGINTEKMRLRAYQARIFPLVFRVWLGFKCTTGRISLRFRKDEAEGRPSEDQVEEKLGGTEN